MQQVKSFFKSCIYIVFKFIPIFLILRYKYIIWTTVFNWSEILEADIDASAAVSSDISMTSEVDEKPTDVCKIEESSKTALDLYSGCGAMSTGLCFGAQLCGQRIVTVSKNLFFSLIFTDHSIV